MPVQTFYNRHQFAPSVALERNLARAFTRRHYAANALLARPDEPTDRLYFVEEGAIQSFYIDQADDEITFASTAESEVIIMPLGLFGSGSQPADYLRAVEPLTVLELPYAELRKLQQTHHDFALLSLQLTEEALCRYEERARMLHNPDPDYRYSWFLSRHKTLAGRLKVQDIASYLGMSRFTLSRLRSQFARNGE